MRMKTKYNMRSRGVASLLALAVVAMGASPAFAKTVALSINLSKPITIGSSGTLPQITVKTATGKSYTLTATNALGATSVTALTFSFQVAAGDFAPNGLVVDSLSVGTATLKDSAGNSLASASGLNQTVSSAKIQTVTASMPSGIANNSIVNKSTATTSLDAAINKVDNATGLSADLKYTDSAATPGAVTFSSLTTGTSYGGNVTVSTGATTGTASFINLSDGLITVTGLLRKTDNSVTGFPVTAGSFYKDLTSPSITASFTGIPTTTSTTPTNLGGQSVTLGGFTGLGSSDRSITVGSTSYSGKYDCWVDLATSPTGSNKIAVATAAALPASGTDTVSLTLPANTAYTSALLGSTLAGQVKLYCTVMDAAGNTSTTTYASSGWYLDFAAPTVQAVSVTSSPNVSVSGTPTYYDDAP